LGEVDGLVEITNESMEPTFSKGSRIAITRLKNQRLLDWGECYYLIDKNWQSSIKRIYPGESSEKIQLVSDNPDRTKYPPYEREWSQIETICKVKAEIKRR
jgi:phage repressor protein C with HTH and peptisase S24 domain